MTHAGDCTRPEPDRDRLKLGWVRLRCPECKHVANVPREVEPSTPKPAPTSGYRCRDHHDQPVTWRGTGCTQCTRVKRKAPKARDDQELGR